MSSGVSCGAVGEGAGRASFCDDRKASMSSVTFSKRSLTPGVAVAVEVIVVVDAGIVHVTVLVGKVNVTGTTLNAVLVSV